MSGRDYGIEDLCFSEGVNPFTRNLVRNLFREFRVLFLFCRFVLFSQDADADTKDNTKKLPVIVKFETDVEVTG